MKPTHEMTTKELHVHIERLRSALRDCHSHMTIAIWDGERDPGFLEARDRAAALLEEGE